MNLLFGEGAERRDRVYVVCSLGIRRHPTLDWCQPENEQGAILRLVQLGFKGGSNAYDRKAVKECAKRRPNWDACLFRWSIGISGTKIDTPSRQRGILFQPNCSAPRFCGLRCSCSTLRNMPPRRTYENHIFSLDSAFGITQTSQTSPDSESNILIFSSKFKRGQPSRWM